MRYLAFFCKRAFSGVGGARHVLLGHDRERAAWVGSCITTSIPQQLGPNPSCWAPRGINQPMAFFLPFSLLLFFFLNDNMGFNPPFMARRFFRLFFSYVLWEEDTCLSLQDDIHFLFFFWGAFVPRFVRWVCLLSVARWRYLFSTHTRRRLRRVGDGRMKQVIWVDGWLPNKMVS